jgi:phosphoribosylformylglycinamidine cyclo-ligase
MPGMYGMNDYDVAGTIVGVVDEKKIVTGKKIRKGDVLIGMPSTGLHTNGYSLARRVLLNKFELDAHFDELGTTLGEALLAVHRSYLHSIHPLLKTSVSRYIHGLSHITGGGIEGNTMRVVPNGLTLRVDWTAWERPAIFNLIKRVGDVPEEDMRRTFNLGVGLIVVADRKGVDVVVNSLKRKQEKPIILGEIVHKQ